MSITVFITNTEPCWVEYGFEVALADDSLTDEQAREVALEQVINSGQDSADPSIQVALRSGPDVRGTIEGMDQEFDVSEVQR